MAEAERRSNEIRSERITHEEPAVGLRRGHVLRRLSPPLLIFLATFGGALLTWLALR